MEEKFLRLFKSSILLKQTFRRHELKNIGSTYNRLKRYKSCGTKKNCNIL